MHRISAQRLSTRHRAPNRDVSRSRARGWGAISLLALVATVAVSCGTGNSGTSSSTPTGNLIVWDFNYNTDAGKSYQQVDQNFIAKFPGVKIQHVAQPATNYGAVVQSAFATKSGPDVLMLQTPFAIKDYYNELTPLNGMITSDMKSQFSGWGGMNPNLDPNGTLYGIPYSFGGTVFYYNKQLWTKAGLDPAKFPTTYADLRTALTQLKGAGITPIGGGDKGGVLGAWFLYIGIPGVMSLQDCYNLGNGKTKWSDPRVKTVLQDFQNFIKDGDLAKNYPELNAGDFSGFGNWINGQAALVWAFPGYRPVLAQNDTTNLGTAPAVLGIDGAAPHFYMAGATLGWTIPTFTKNKTAAWEYIKYMTGTEAQQLHLNVDKVGPTNLNVDMSKADPDLTAAFNLWKATPNSEHCGRLWQGDVVAKLSAEMTKVEAGQETIDQATAAADALQAQH